MRDHDDEHCEDITCKTVKDDVKSWMSSTKKDHYKDCPIDREGLGRNTWSLLHTISVKYPEKPTDVDKKNMNEFIRLVSVFYPCKDCAQQFRIDIESKPPNLDSRDGLSNWFCEMHNTVNEKLSKKTFDCTLIYQRWKKGWEDGSCDRS